ncbi:MAG TPA: molybdate ABC transporter permease subunit [Polyangiaceae bacterium]|nr:molybdate ABC transporter permease subunit [Polyangiaceae bacterium]
MTFAPLLLTFEVATLAVIASAAIGVTAGSLLARRKLPGSDLLNGIVTAPMVLPPTVLGYYVLVLFGRRSPLGRAFEAVTGTSIVFSFSGVVLAATIGSLPLVVMSSRAALESVDPVLRNAARTLGAGPLRAFLTVELPLAAPGIVAGLMLGFARALGDFGVTLMVAGDIPGHTQTASLAIYDAIQSNRENDALGMIGVLTFIAVGALFVAGRLTRAPRVL